MGEVTSDHLAYIMYTSGSTGHPKGVAIPHRGVIRLVKETNYANFDKNEIFLQFAPISFDASTLEIWGALLNGGRLVVAPPGLPSLEQLGKTLHYYQITTLWLTAGLFHQMVEYHIQSLKGVRQLLAGGDILSMPHVEKVLQEIPECRLINGYGPTANTTFATCYTISRTEQFVNSIPIGRAISNTRMYILNEHYQPVPVGMYGEVYIAGDGLARGYLHRPDLTAERFIPHPFSDEPGERFYRTGDVARYLSTGDIEFQGRRDNQIKLRGFRIELGEIEHVLNQHSEVHGCAVIIQEDIPGSKQLVAYIENSGSKNLSDRDLQQYLQEKLPAYMVPTIFVRLESLPLTANGKVDRRFLLSLQKSEEGEVGEQEKAVLQQYIPPRDEIEFQLVQIWEEILQTQPLGILDNFFELGGHSIVAMRLMSHINKQFGRELRLSTLFQFPTIAELAMVLREQIGYQESNHVLVTLQSHGTKMPFFCVHPAGGEVFCYTGLAHLMGSDRPFHALQACDWSHQERSPDIEEMAASYIHVIRSVQPHGPYLLGGWSFGGIVAFEMAQQLQMQGEKISFLAIIDSMAPAREPRNADDREVHREPFVGSKLEFLDMPVPEGGETEEERFAHLYQYLKDTHVIPADADMTHARRFLHTVMINRDAVSRYIPRVYSGDITYLRAEESMNVLQGHAQEGYTKITGGWEDLTTGTIKAHLVAGDHESIIVGQHISILAAVLRNCIDPII